MEDRNYYRVYLFLVIGFILVLILNYDINWMLPELKRQMHYAFSNGSSLNLNDFIRCFNYAEVHDSHRVRFASYLLTIINLKFRLWLLQYIFPHPSFSLIWICTLILAPILLFKFMYNFTSSYTASRNALLLYMMSTGFLSGITLLFHPAKPMIVFLTIFCLYLASKIKLFIIDKEWRKGIFLYIVMFASLFIMFITDEFALASFICMPFFFFGIFHSQKKGAFYLLYFAPVVLAIAFVMIIVPRISDFSASKFVNVAVNGNNTDGWHNFNFQNIFLNIRNTMFSHILPYSELPGHNSAGNLFKKTYFLGGIILGYFCYLFVRLDGNKKKLFLSSFFALLIATLLYSIGSQFHEGLVYSGCYYYGSFLSLFFVLPVSILLSVKDDLCQRINKFILLYFLIIFAYNFHALNDVWIRDHHPYEDFAKELKIRSYGMGSKELIMNRKLTLAMVIKAWKKRGDEHALLLLKEEYPVHSRWLFWELEYLARYKYSQENK